MNQRLIIFLVLALLLGSGVFWYTKRRRGHETTREVSSTTSKGRKEKQVEPRNRAKKTEVEERYNALRSLLNNHPALQAASSDQKLKLVEKYQDQALGIDKQMHIDAFSALGTANLRQIQAISQAKTPEEQRRAIAKVQRSINTPRYKKARDILAKGYDDKKALYETVKSDFGTPELMEASKRAAKYSDKKVDRRPRQIKKSRKKH